MKNLKKLLLLAGICFLSTIESQAQIDTDYYYRLTNTFLKEGRSLDTYSNGDNTPFMGQTGNYSGQHWKFTPLGNGYYRLTNAFLGDSRSLDTYSNGDNTPFMGQTGNYSGQYWKLTPVGNGYYRLTNSFLKEGRSLDTYSNGKNTPFMGQTGNYSRQYWKLTKTRRVSTIQAPSGFHMIFASDPQYPRTKNSIEDEAKAIRVNNNHVKSINQRVSDLGKNNVRGLIMNGDLTEYGHKGELSKFEEIYGKISVKKYLGLGNHDYANNVDDCYENNCANRMVEYMIDHIKANKYPNSDYTVTEGYEFPEIVKKTNGSLAYSWDLGNVHFVQLHNYPSYTTDWSNYVSLGAAKRKTVNITSSMSWLEKDLAKARNAGKVIILNFHDSYGHWGDNKNATQVAQVKTQFKEMLSKYGVSAVFVGHYHELSGENNRQAIRGSNVVDYDAVPVIYCGSSIESKYISVHFESNQMTVTRISSDGGSVTVDATNVRTYPLNSGVPTTPLPIPQADGYVTFFNQSGYVAKYSLSYTVSGQSKYFNTGNMALGNTKRYTIPGNATNIRVKGEGKTGLVWEPWRTTFDKTYGSVISKCFKSYGTTLHQQWNNKCE